MQWLHARFLQRRAFSLTIQTAGGGTFIADRVVEPSHTRRRFFMASSSKRSGRSSHSRQQRSQRQPREEPNRQNIESSRQGDSGRSPSVNQPMPRDDRSSDSQPEQDERESLRPGGSGDRPLSSER
jgi:hypothetical protein